MKEILKRILVNIKTQLFTEKFATWILVLYFVLISVVFTIHCLEGYSDFWIPLLVSCGVYNVVLLIVKTVCEEVWRGVEEKKCIEQNQG